MPVKKGQKYAKRDAELVDNLIEGNLPEFLDEEIKKKFESKEWNFKHLNKFSPWHHSAAQMIAAGVKITEVAKKLGRSKTRIYRLRCIEPAFNELIEFYRELQTKVTLDLTEQLEKLSSLAADELLRRIKINPSKFSNKELFELLRLAADRTGHGPTSKVEGEFSANGVAKIMLERLDKVKAEVVEQEKEDVQIIDVEEVKELPSP